LGVGRYHLWLLALSLAGASGACGPGAQVDLSITDGGGGKGGTGGRGGAGGAIADGAGGAAGAAGSAGAAGAAGTGGSGDTGGSAGDAGPGADGSGGAAGGTGGGPADAGRDGAVDVVLPPDLRPDLPVDAPLPVDMAPRPDVALPPDAPPGLNLAMGLITRLKLDEGMGTSTADSGGSMNTGMLNGGTAWITPGAPGTKYANPAALHFDGNDDFVEVGTRNMRSNNQPQSVTFWMRYTGTPDGAHVCVSVTQGGGGEARLKLGFNDGQVRAWKSSSDPLVSTGIPAAGWHHYAYTYDGTTNRLYLDGTLRAMSTTDTDNGPPANVRLGAIHNNAENFQGDLDDVRFYSRAIAPTEVTALSQGLE
jgi:hypothetical protein